MREELEYAARGLTHGRCHECMMLGEDGQG